MERLGFGTQVTIDGYNADPAHLLDEARVREFLQRTARALEPDRPEPVSIVRNDEGGISAGVALDESHLALHTFEMHRTLSFVAFSRKELHPAQLLGALRDEFRIGRYESHLANRARVYPREPELLRAVLLGDRAYTGVRLDSSLLTY